jgi:arsenate reductase (thioredoxin)
MSGPPKLRVLFICIGNSCRSPMAEAIARRDAADLMEPLSAGIAPLGAVARLTTETLQANGYAADGLASKPLDLDVWDAADLVINMSGYPRERTFPGASKVEDWDIPDPYGADPGVYQRIFEDIRNRIEELAARLRAERDDQL